MKFPYREYISRFPGTEDFRLILRPVITVRIAGARASARWDALVDTGADETLLPLSVAEVLGVDLAGAPVGEATGISAERLRVMYADVELQLGENDESVAWVGFVEFDEDADELVILGHGGCLDYFTAIFNGEAAELELSPNGLLPNSTTLCSN